MQIVSIGNSLHEMSKLALIAQSDVRPTAQEAVGSTTARYTTSGILCIIGRNRLTFLTLKSRMDSFANSVDPDEMACHELSHLYPHFLRYWS